MASDPNNRDPTNPSNTPGQKVISFPGGSGSRPLGEGGGEPPAGDGGGSSPSRLPDDPLDRVELVKYFKAGPTLHDHGDIDDPSVLEDVCTMLVCGFSLGDICRVRGMPSRVSMYRAMARKPFVRQAVDRARRACQDARVDMMYDMMMVRADPMTVGLYKAQVDHLRWEAGKHAPRVYGDNKQVTLAPEGPEQLEGVVVDLTTLDDEELNALENVLDKIKAEK